MVNKNREIPPTTISRLPLYLRTLTNLKEKGVSYIPSHDLAEKAGSNAAQLRKDLSYLGEFGTRGVGYNIKQLHFQISRCLGLTKKYKIAIIGMGKLGPALKDYQGFKESGFEISAVFDSDPSKIGKKINKLIIEDVKNLKEVIRKKNIEIGIITTPAEAAQGVAETMVEGGISAILNFAPVYVEVSKKIVVRQVDLSNELQILSFYLSRK